MCLTLEDEKIVDLPEECLPCVHQNHGEAEDGEETKVALVGQVDQFHDAGLRRKEPCLL